MRGRRMLELSVDPSVRLLAIDIDGTLLDSTFQIPEVNLKSLRRAHEQGVQICLVTGRRHAFALPVAELLGFEICLITSNGAITRTSAGTLFHRDLLPQASARKLLAHMATYRRDAVITFDKNVKGALVVEDKAYLCRTIARWVQSNSAYIDEILPMEASLTEDAVQVMYCGTVARMSGAEVLLRDAALAGDVTVSKTQYEQRDLCILDVLQHSCSKGAALERWAGHLQIPREQIMAIGDNYNDIEMLEFAGYPVIMGNASSDLKRNGWRVTGDNDSGGVSAAVEQVIEA